MKPNVKTVKDAKKVTSSTMPNGAKSVKNSKEIEKATLKVNTILTPTAEGRLSNLKVLNTISEKYSDLKSMQEDLDIFRASLDSTNQSCVLKNSQGREFRVSNSETFKKVLSVVVEDLTTFTQNAEKEVLNFQL